MGAAFEKLFSSFFGLIWGLLRFFFGFSLFFVICFLGFFFIRYRFNPLRLRLKPLKRTYIRYKYFDLFRWLLVDFLERNKHRGEFREFGFTFFVGRQGAGKTISMVRYLEVLKERYPECVIVTNFQYYRSDHIMTDWRDLLTIRNGINGVVFAVDEIHSEYDSSKWNDIPEDLLSEISQQRKQRVKIIASAQFFTRVAKPLREQAVTVVSCDTFLGRLTTNREYDALDYACIVDNPLVARKKIKPLRKSSFVQSDFLRQCYDTYAKVERMSKTSFSRRADRVRG
jgi:hypothetical protein